jgi:hypothetical protein
MNEYNVINRCLSTLNSSNMDVMTKLRMESLLVGIKMLLLADVMDQENMPDLEKLLKQVKEACSDRSTDSAQALIDQVRKMQSSMAACLNLSN